MTKVISHCKYVPFYGHLKHKPDLNFGQLLPIQKVYWSKQASGTGVFNMQWKPIKWKELGTEKEKWVLKLLERIISMKTKYLNTLKMQVTHSQIALQSCNFSDSWKRIEKKNPMISLVLKYSWLWQSSNWPTNSWANILRVRMKKR